MSAPDTLRRVPESSPTVLVCPQCAKALEAEPNFCPACGYDFRGRTDSSDTFSRNNDTIDGRYKVLEKLGQGGMGSVFKVEHVRMGKMAALKLLQPDAAVDKGLKARFLQEARVVAKLSHPNTVQVFDTGELPDGSLYITMEFVPGKDLAWHLKAHGALSELRAVSIGIQILNSLQEAHELGVVHRDIKPANVMLMRLKKGAEERVKLVDFGIAKLQEGEGRSSITGDFVGTPAYMSPEQVRGEEVDARSDLYSLGALLFELVSGRPLFEGKNPMHTARQHLDTPAPHVLEVAPEVAVSEAFENVIQKALAKEPQRRFQSAEQMKNALLEVRKHFGAFGSDEAPSRERESALMLSREDFDQFENRLRLWRILTPLLWLSGLLIVGALGFHFYNERRSDASLPRGVEDEPNDTVRQATRFQDSIQGSIGSSSSNTADRDLFFTDVEAGSYRLNLTAVEDLNLTVEVLQFQPGSEREKLSRVVFLDDHGDGKSEHLEALFLSQGPVYFRLQELAFCTAPERKSREKALVSYTLSLEKMQGPDFEHEPNDTPAQATLLTSSQAAEGFASQTMESTQELSELRPSEPFSWYDWYRVEAKGLVCVVPEPNQKIQVVDKKQWDEWVVKNHESRVQKMSSVLGYVVQRPICFEPFLDVKNGSKLEGHVRISSKEETIYRVFFVTPTQDDALLQTLRRLKIEGRKEQAEALVSALREKWGSAVDAMALDEVLR
jgi:serine/threonine protein kinase